MKKIISICIYLLAIFTFTVIHYDTSVYAEDINHGVIMVGESHMCITDGFVFTDMNEWKPYKDKGLGTYKASLAGYKKKVDIFFVHTGAEGTHGSVDWACGAAISRVKEIQSAHPEINKWHIYLQHGASSALRNNEENGLWEKYERVHKAYVDAFGEVYVMEIPPINEYNWNYLYKDDLIAGGHNNEQVKKFNNYIKTLCNGSTVKFVSCFQWYIGKPFADKSVGRSAKDHDPNHYSASTYAKLVEWVIRNTIGEKTVSIIPTPDVICPDEPENPKPENPKPENPKPPKPGTDDDEKGFYIETPINEFIDDIQYIYE